MRTAADQVQTACFFQRFDHHIFIFGPVVLHERTLHGLILVALGHIYLFTGTGIHTRIEHTGRKRSGRGIKILYLFGVQMRFLHILSQQNRVIQRAAGMARHEVRHDVLIHSVLFVGFFVARQEFFKNLFTGFSHVVQHLR